MKLHSTELPYLADASGYYLALADLPATVWLDSAGMGRYDILAAAPHRSLVIENGCEGCNPFDLIRGEMGDWLLPDDGDIPFAGGAMGYWSYDLARTMMTLPSCAADGERLPLMAIGIYDWALVVDHQLCRTRLVSYQRYAETDALLLRIRQLLQGCGVATSSAFKVHGQIVSNFTYAMYQKAFARVQGYLQAGDCYQINLAQRFIASASGNPLAVYLALRKASPAPYSAFLNLPQVQIMCASPERFIRVTDGQVETKPIKGTRPRDADAQRDRQQAEALRLHPKDRAENLMIVDLLRNDLGKSCVPGTVRVPKLFEVESYAQVHHLVSTVQGELAVGKDALHVLADCFPGGSITGAPKQRAMEIIEQLEPDRRGIYCGVIGYVGFDGKMDSNIAIRTLVYSQGQIRCWAGGGIVADSDCQAEHQETMDKASAMLKILREFGGEYALR